MGNQRMFHNLYAHRSKLPAEPERPSPASAPERLYSGGVSLALPDPFSPRDPRTQHLLIGRCLELAEQAAMGADVPVGAVVVSPEHGDR